MRLKLSDYSLLSTIGGPVRLTAGPLPSVVVNRASSTTFYAMSIMCQHQGCYVAAYNNALDYMR